MVDFTIKNLEVFLTVVEKNSFSLAASKLYLSQSTVSTAISTLENTLGVTL
ncbi:MAG: LysR family transcriptional regulator, partial [Oscillospiraceae bacterium]|nr:LysR family transcriptional regulator [Oscillospiraceae bacterium]